MSDFLTAAAALAETPLVWAALPGIIGAYLIHRAIRPDDDA